MPNTFYLEDLDPERPGLEFKGVRYLAALPDDFGLETEARLKRLHLDTGEAEKIKNGEKRAKKLEEIMGEIIQIYFPNMPSSLIQKIPSPKKIEIMAWWGQECFPQRIRLLEEAARGQVA